MFDEEREFGLWDAECLGCDLYTSVDDIGLCEESAAKFDRDLIRQRNWAYSATAFGCPPEKYEELRAVTIAQHGAERIVPDPEPPRRRRRRRGKRGRGKRGR